MSGQKSRHLVFLAHIWVLMPLLALWKLAPSLAGAPTPGLADRFMVYWVIVAAYLLARTALALRDPRWLRWD